MATNASLSFKAMGPVHHLTSSVLLPFNTFPRIPLALVWLASIWPSSLFFLVTTHASSQSDVYSWGRLEAEAFGNFDEIKLVNVEN